MICPNCLREMSSTIIKFKPRQYQYDCHYCGVVYGDNNGWFIPLCLRPTIKQYRTIRLIENRLHIDFDDDKIVTKRQCCDIIGKYLEEANKVTPGWSSFDDEDADLMGLNPGMFC